MKQEIFESKSFKGNKVRIYFNDFERTLIFGQFAELEDKKELLSKGMFRFVPERWSYEFNDSKHIKYTKIYQISNIKEIIEY